MSNLRQHLKQNGVTALPTDAILAKQKRTTSQPMRVQNYEIPLHRPAEFAVSNVFGYGRQRSKRLAASVGAFGHFPLDRMRESQRTQILRTLRGNAVAYDNPEQACGAALIQEIEHNIQRLKDIKCYRGIRHAMRLPVRGQRTKTNARTRRKGGRLR